jgi:hypothetical protein
MHATTLDPLNSGATSPDEDLEFFKFYQEAAEKTKAHAWSQTTWILTLNVGMLAFSLQYFTDHGSKREARVIEFITTVVGVLLAGFLIYLLNELGKHIRRYWTTSNKLAASNDRLRGFIDEDEVEAAKTTRYKAAFPKFCRRLQILAVLFIGVHIGWLLLALFFIGFPVNP